MNECHTKEMDYKTYIKMVDQTEFYRDMIKEEKLLKSMEDELCQTGAEQA